MRVYNYSAIVGRNMLMMVVINTFMLLFILFIMFLKHIYTIRWCSKLLISFK